MALFTWTQHHSVGIEELDRQHVEFFAIINDLYDAIRRSDRERGTGMTLKRLVAFAGEHFVAEEQVMDDAGFPGLRRHRAHHRELSQRLDLFMKRYEGGEVGLTIDLLIFVGDWLIDHIERFDKAYEPWLKSHGSRSEGHLFSEPAIAAGSPSQLRNDGVGEPNG